MSFDKGKLGKQGLITWSSVTCEPVVIRITRSDGQATLSNWGFSLAPALRPSMQCDLTKRAGLAATAGAQIGRILCAILCHHTIEELRLACSAPV